MSGTLRDSIPNSPPPKRSGRWDWLFWWQVDPDKLEEQVDGYKTLRPWQSMRGISALCLLASSALTLAFAFLSASAFDPDILVDVGLMLGLAVFIYFGHRWAMIGAMLLWSLEKVIGVVETGGIGIIPQE